MRGRWIAMAVAAAVLATGCGGATQPNPAQNYAKDQKPGGSTPAPTPTPTPAPTATKQWTQPPAMEIDVNKQYFATMKTSLGDIRIELLPKESPKTVNNFVFLAKQGFYDGTTFHRIMKNFMIQGGDPKGTGGGGPGYKFADELPPKHSYDPGIVAMANAGPNTNGSQFFICNGPACKASLDPNPNYTQFGKVVAGMDVVQKISSVAVTTGGDGNQSKPTTPPVIEKVTIDEK
jgi:cyclophilin family peptidyl-prolyl cis-trans isomerase